VLQTQELAAFFPEFLTPETPAVRIKFGQPRLDSLDLLLHLLRRDIAPYTGNIVQDHHKLCHDSVLSFRCPNNAQLNNAQPIVSGLFRFAHQVQVHLMASLAVLASRPLRFEPVFAVDDERRSVNVLVIGGFQIGAAYKFEYDSVRVAARFGSQPRLVA
jgi:hypothetical protein